MQSPADIYRARFRKVLEYIDAHLDEDLAVARLCAVAAFSKYHFHRQFTALFGVGAFRYVQLTRLKRASYQLAFREEPIVDIALSSGYGGPEAFARAFKSCLGQSPSEFRQCPQWNAWHSTFDPLTELRMHHMNPYARGAQVRIVDCRDIAVAVLEHRGNPQRLGESIRKFIEWRKQNKLPPSVSATFNIAYDHPTETQPDDFRFDLCAATEREVADNDFGVVGKTIPGGRCAVLRHVGSDDNLIDSANYLYSQWLPQSGEELRDFPLYFQRVRFFPDVPEHEAITELFLPLR